MENPFDYIYCFRDGTFPKNFTSHHTTREIQNNVKFVKKGRCYKVRWHHNFFANKKIPSSFKNEQKDTHYFGIDSNPEEKGRFFEKYFKTPKFKHLIIEKKM